MGRLSGPALTKEQLTRLKPGQLVWDGNNPGHGIPGLGVRCGQDRRLTWRLKVPVAKAGIRRSNKDGSERIQKFRVETLNPNGDMTLAEARTRAIEVKGEIYREVGDPVAMRRRAKAAEITLGEAWGAWVDSRKVRRVLRNGQEAKKACAASTLRSYEDGLRLNFEDWKGRTLAALARDRDAFEVRFNDITMERGPIAANRAIEMFGRMWRYTEAKHPDLKALGCPAEIIAKGELNKETERKSAYQPDELPAAVNAVWRAGRFRAGVHLFMMLSGQRSGGVKSALRTNYDRAAGTLLLDTKGTRHLVPLSPAMVDLLDAMIALGDRHFKGTPFIFPSHGKKGHVTDVRIDAPASALMAQHRATIGRGVGSDIGGHIWRHTWRSLYPVAGLSRHDATMMIGHADGEKRTAHDIYAAPVVSHLRGQQAIMSEYLMKQAGYEADFRFSPNYFSGVRELDAISGLI